MHIRAAKQNPKPLETREILYCVRCRFLVRPARERLPCVVLSLGTSTDSARAGAISFSAPFGPAAIFSPAATIPLDKFDGALGTLTSVTIQVEADTSGGTIAWDNEALIPSDVDLGIGAEVTATAPSALTAVAVPLQLGSGSVTADSDGAADFIGQDSFTLVGGTGSDTKSVTSSAAGVLTFYTAAFVGETFDTDVESKISTFLSTTGGFGPIESLPGVFEGTLTVTYNFTPVPEPSTALLLVVGGLGLGWRKTRRRR